MHTITKEIEIPVGGSPTAFRLTKLDAFSGVALLRLLLREPAGGSVLDLIASLTEEELRSVLSACLNHTEVRLPAGYHPVMTGSEWGFPELEHDTPSCMRLLLESLSFNLSGFFAEGGRSSPPAPADTSP